MNHVMFKVQKGGQEAVPEFREIREFCEKRGTWDDMLAVEAEIKQKMQVN